MLPKTPLFVPFLLFLVVVLFGCSDDESNDGFDKQKVDPLIVGSWRHPSSPTGFSIAEDGTVTYLKINQLTGKFVSDKRFQDRIEAINGTFKFTESDNCYTEIDSTYSLNHGSLEIPISRGWQLPVAYLPLDIESYESTKRKESFIKGRIELYETKFGDTFYNFNASDEFSDIKMLSFSDVGTFLIGFSEPDIACNLPIQLHNYIQVNTSRAINEVGVYELRGGNVQILVQENGGIYNLVFDNPSEFRSGQLTVSNYSEDESSKLVEGSFEFSISTPEFNENERTVRVTNGSFKIYELLE